MTGAAAVAAGLAEPTGLVTMRAPLNVSSTEAPVERHPAHADPRALMDALDQNLPILPPSALYALAAIETG